MKIQRMVLGIDSGRFHHEFALTDHTGKVWWHKRVPNLMLSLRAAVRQVVAKMTEPTFTDCDLVFALEMDHGNSGALVRYLLAAGHDVRLCAPLRLKRYRESLGTGNKNDKKDARLVAQFCHDRFPELPRAHRPRPARQVLRALSRQLDRLGRDVTRQTHYLKGVLVEYYPDLVTAGLLGDLTSATARAFLKRYAVLSKAKRASVKTLAECLRKASRGQVGEDRAREIKEHLKDYDLPPLVEQGYAETVRSLLTTLETLLREESRLLHLADQIAQGDPGYEKLLAVPGFGVQLTIKLLGETGETDAYKNEEHWAAHAGFVPVERQSGEGTGIRFLPRSCNKRLRHSIYQSCVASLKASPACRAYYDRKVAEPPANYRSGKGTKYKPSVRAFIAMGRHRCRLLWKLLTTDQSYDERRLGQPTQAAV